MKAESIFTRNYLGLDSRVWITLIIAVLLSGALFGFRVATTIPCADISIGIQSMNNPGMVSFFQKDALTFTAITKNQGAVVWDFGDNSEGQGERAIHSYAIPGTYYVTATVNDKCREFVPVIVVAQTMKIAAPVAGGGELSIEGPEAPKAGEPASYSTLALGQNYEWNVLNSPEYPTQRTPIATYLFTTAGTKNIELKVDGKPVRKIIQVLPGEMKPPTSLPGPQPLPNNYPAPEPLPEKPKAPKAKILPAEEFTSMLEKVTKGDMNASSFDAYLCEGGAAATRVLLNDKTWSNLSAFCDKISKNKKYNIKNTEVIRDDNGCVKQLKIKYCKWVTLGLKCKEE